MVTSGIDAILDVKTWPKDDKRERKSGALDALKFRDSAYGLTSLPLASQAESDCRRATEQTDSS